MSASVKQYTATATPRKDKPRRLSPDIEMDEMLAMGSIMMQLAGPKQGKVTTDAASSRKRKSATPSGFSGQSLAGMLSMSHLQPTTSSQATKPLSLSPTSITYSQQVLDGGNPEFHAVFGTEFNSHYLRTNKSAEKKHLRCFPHHRSGGHRDTGFCGSSVRMHITAAAADFRRWRDTRSFRTVAELRPLSDPVRMTVGTEMHSETVTNMTKTKKNFVDRPFFNGVVLYGSEQGEPVVEGSPQSFVCEFNSQLRGWHYTWCGAVRPNEPHNLTAYMMEETIVDGRGVLRCIKIIESTSFVLLCGRRKLNCQATKAMLNGSLNGVPLPPSPDKKKTTQPTKKRKLSTENAPTNKNMDKTQCFLKKSSDVSETGQPVEGKQPTLPSVKNLLAGFDRKPDDVTFSSNDLTPPQSHSSIPLALSSAPVSGRVNAPLPSSSVRMRMEGASYSTTTDAIPSTEPSSKVDVNATALLLAILQQQGISPEAFLKSLGIQNVKL